MEIKKWRKVDGPIKWPGVYAAVQMARYHAKDLCIEPSVSSTALRKVFLETPKAYWAHSVYNESAVAVEETDAMVLGRAAHHLLLGESGFTQQFAVAPATIGGKEWRYGGNARKFWLEDRQKEGRTVLTQTQFEKLNGICLALKDDPAVKAGALNGNIEITWAWKHERTGIWLKARPDVHPTADLSFVDLKITRSVAPDVIERSMREYGYYQQAAMTGMGCLELFKRPMDSFSFLFVESEYPHDIEFVMVKPHEIDRGIRCNEVALTKIAEGFKTGIWPGYRGMRAEPRWIEMNERAAKYIDERLQLEGV